MSREYVELDEPPTASSIALYLEQLVSSWVDAVNARQLDTGAAIYESVDSNFRAIPGPPALPIKVDLEGYVAHMRSVITEHPDFTMHVLDFDTTVAPRHREAQVFVNYEVSGAPTGVIRRSIGIFRFKKKIELDGNEAWKCFTAEVMDGMEPAGMGL